MLGLLQPIPRILDFQTLNAMCHTLAKHRIILLSSSWRGLANVLIQLSYSVDLGIINKHNDATTLQYFALESGG